MVEFKDSYVRLSGLVQLSSPIVVPSKHHLDLAVDARLVADGNFPAVIMAGNHSILTGFGELQTTHPDNEGILQIGMEGENVVWPIMRDFRIIGAGQGVGIREIKPSSGKGVYWGKVRDIHIERVDVGVLGEEGSNGHAHSEVSFHKINKSCFEMKGFQFGIYGGSVHRSPSVIVHDYQGAKFSYSDGVRAEPGEGSRFAVLDKETIKNQIRGVSNINLPSIDEGRGNHMEWQSNAD